MDHIAIKSAAKKRELIKLLDNAIAAADSLNKSIDSFEHELRIAHNEEKMAA